MYKLQSTKYNAQCTKHNVEHTIKLNCIEDINVFSFQHRPLLIMYDIKEKKNLYKCITFHYHCSQVEN